MSKKVQVSEGFLAGVWCLLDSLKDYELDSITAITCRVLQSEVDEKYAAIERRDAFSKYKTATPGSREREAFRKAYLDAAAIHRDWHTQKDSSS